jgi:transcriptional regulator with XRE-family HTH domain
MLLNEQIIGCLKAERIRQGLSQRDLAARMDRHVSYIQKIEHGVGDRQVSGYQLYANALNVSLRVEVSHPAN